MAIKKSVELKIHAPEAKKVIVAGDFNKWEVSSLKAKKENNGTWTAKLSLAPGRYEYKFLIDGNWHNDPACQGCVPNAFGSKNCVVIVN